MERIEEFKKFVVQGLREIMMDDPDNEPYYTEQIIDVRRQHTVEDILDAAGYRDAEEKLSCTVIFIEGTY